MTLLSPALELARPARLPIGLPDSLLIGSPDTTLTAPPGGNTGLQERALALLGQYMASSFATVSEGHGATPFTDPQHDQYHHLSLPHAA
jgi:hypothetical protein